MTRNSCTNTYVDLSRFAPRCLDTGCVRLTCRGGVLMISGCVNGKCYCLATVYEMADVFWFSFRSHGLEYSSGI